MITSIILALHFLGVVPAESAYLSLYIVGLVLLIAEIGVVSFGMLFVNGLLALYAGYSLHMGQPMFFNIPMGWGVIFSVAFIEFITIAAAVIIWKKVQNIKTETGAEGMIGQKVQIVNWDGIKGKVKYEGEIWQAESKAEMDFNKDDEVSIESVGKMKLIVKA